MYSGEQLTTAYQGLSPYERSYVDKRCGDPCGPDELLALYNSLSPGQRSLVDQRIKGGTPITPGIVKTAQTGVANLKKWGLPAIALVGALGVLFILRP